MLICTCHLICWGWVAEKTLAIKAGIHFKLGSFFCSPWKQLNISIGSALFYCFVPFLALFASKKCNLRPECTISTAVGMCTRLIIPESASETREAVQVSFRDVVASSCMYRVDIVPNKVIFSYFFFFASSTWHSILFKNASSWQAGRQIVQVESP